MHFRSGPSSRHLLSVSPWTCHPIPTRRLSSFPLPALWGIAMISRWKGVPLSPRQVCRPQCTRASLVCSKEQLQAQNTHILCCLWAKTVTRHHQRHVGGGTGRERAIRGHVQYFESNRGGESIGHRGRVAEILLLLSWLDDVLCDCSISSG